MHRLDRECLCHRLAGAHCRALERLMPEMGGEAVA
jgi:hypothetical protein